MIHIYPIDDFKEHNLEGTICECEPEVDWNNGLVIHNSFDCREIFERAEKILEEM